MKVYVWIETGTQMVQFTTQNRPPTWPGTWMLKGETMLAVAPMGMLQT